MPGPQDVDIKPVVWIGTSRRDLRKLPDDVQEVFGYALYLAQTGKKHLSTKPLKGFGGASVLEVVEDYRGDTYRAVYTVKFVEAVYVLHVFQKGYSRYRHTASGDRTDQRAHEARAGISRKF